MIRSLAPALALAVVVVVVAVACTQPLELCTGAPPTDGTARVKDDAFAVCAGGTYERTTSAACEDAPEPVCGAPAVGASHECTTNAQCDDGRCVAGADGTCGCIPRCSADDDCGAGTACICGEVRNDGRALTYAQTCQPAQCRTTADCKSGERCALSVFGCEVQGLFCMAASDECTDDDMCGAEVVCGRRPEDDGWRCTQSACVD